MTPDLDDHLRVALRDLAAAPVRPIDEVADDVRRRRARRRTRRRGTLVAGVAFLVVVSVGVVASLGRPDTVTSGAPEVPEPDGPQGAVAGLARPLTITGLDAVAGADGTDRVEIRFDAPLPEVPVTHVADITAPDAPGLAYTTQGPSGLHVCQDRHWFPGDTGTVDVLIPAVWLAEDTNLEEIPYTWKPAGRAHGKIPACGAYAGYVQFSIWGPASDDPDDVRVHISDDRTALVVEISAG